ncbi:MAG: RsmB/NOP family class I SAM-dependent RNA methyltransferase [Verrucomicrobia bacterium]|nr:RsmB/NOP family class I SAM-dependent RNA methyltransferase [Verrucomicrobiota bacterium]
MNKTSHGGHHRRPDRAPQGRPPAFRRPNIRATTGGGQPARAIDIATDVIRKAEAGHPADGLLREALRAARGVSPDGARRAARWVFDWYRWQGWFQGSEPLPQKIQMAAEMADAFESGRGGVSLEDLRTRAVPSWTQEEMTVSEAWLRAIQKRPALWIRARAASLADLAMSVRGLERPALAFCGQALEHCGDEDLFRLPQFHEGQFELQDWSSQAVGHWCAPKPGETWWDACAGEGGKTLHLSELMGNKGLIWASDRADWRLKKLKQRAARAGVFNYRSALWEGGAKLPTKTRFDGVLVDAPCSGIGTWQRNPHARWTTRPTDIRELAEVQQRLLDHVTPSLKPGGRLVYSVCTLSRAETTEVVQAFHSRHPEMEPVPLSMPDGLESNQVGQAWLWPQDIRANGMFVAAWKKKE